ncbi:MAG TPA: thioredoxin domain-containing protein [Nitrospirota bacterium]|nr:thioredoxin domain-containing protein [Nitrospirota bacterium]
MSNNSIIIRCRVCRTLNRTPEEKLASHPVCGHCRTPLEVPRAPINVTTSGYDPQINDWPEIVLAEFWAKWCGYCRAIEPFINELAARRAGRLKIVRVDVDSEPVLARRFTIKATPTFILYRNGRQLARFDGAPARTSELDSWIDRTMLQTVK